MWSVIVVAAVVVAAAAQLFWKPAELNVGPCISLTLILHVCCLTLMSHRSETTWCQPSNERKSDWKPKKLHEHLCKLLSSSGHNVKERPSLYVSQQILTQDHNDGTFAIVSCSREPNGCTKQTRESKLKSISAKLQVPPIMMKWNSLCPPRNQSNWAHRFKVVLGEFFLLKIWFWNLSKKSLHGGSHCWFHLRSWGLKFLQVLLFACCSLRLPKISSCVQQLGCGWKEDEKWNVDSYWAGRQNVLTLCRMKINFLPFNWRNKNKHELAIWKGAEKQSLGW